MRMGAKVDSRSSTCKHMGAGGTLLSSSTTRRSFGKNSSTDTTFADFLKTWFCHLVCFTPVCVILSESPFMFHAAPCLHHVCSTLCVSSTSMFMLSVSRCLFNVVCSTPTFSLCLFHVVCSMCLCYAVWFTPSVSHCLANVGCFPLFVSRCPFHVVHAVCFTLSG